MRAPDGRVGSAPPLAASAVTIVPSTSSSYSPSKVACCALAERRPTPRRVALRRPQRERARPRDTGVGGGVRLVVDAPISSVVARGRGGDAPEVVAGARLAARSAAEAYGRGSSGRDDDGGDACCRRRARRAARLSRALHLRRRRRRPTRKGVEIRRELAATRARSRSSAAPSAWARHAALRRGRARGNVDAMNGSRRSRARARSTRRRQRVDDG